jgi:hypothetical protein
MNNSIKQLKQEFIINNVTNMKEGLETLNKLFSDDQIIYSLEKEEWNNLNKKQKTEFVKTLLSYEIPEEITDLSDDKSKEVIDVELDKSEETDDELDDDSTDWDYGEYGPKEEPIEEDDEINEQPNTEEELNQLVEQDIEYFLKQKQELLIKLNEVNQTLKELGYNEVPTGLTKMEIAKQWKLDNPNGTRKDFFKDNSELGSKNLLSTYFQKIK